VQEIKEIQTSQELELKTLSTSAIKNLDNFYAQGGKIDNVILGNVNNSSIINLSSFTPTQTGISLELKGRYQSKKIETKLNKISIKKEDAFENAKFKITQNAIEDFNDEDDINDLAKKIEKINEEQDEDPVPELFIEKITAPILKDNISIKVNIIRSRFSSGSGTGTSIGISLIDAFLNASGSSTGEAIGISLVDQALFDLFIYSALFGPDEIKT
jgi:hypothetical protein